MAQLELWRGDTRSTYRLDAERVIVGRDRACHVCVDDPRVSRQHAAVFREGNRYYVEDLGSTNGTTVDDVPLRPWRPVPIDHSSRIGLAGSMSMTFVLPPEEREFDCSVTLRERGQDLRLTPTETEVLHLLFMHYQRSGPLPQIASVDDIAAERGSSAAAVKQVLQGLYNKFGLHGADRNKDTLARRAIDSALVKPPG